MTALSSRPFMAKPDPTVSGVHDRICGSQSGARWSVVAICADTGNDPRSTWTELLSRWASTGHCSIQYRGLAAGTFCKATGAAPTATASRFSASLMGHLFAHATVDGYSNRAFDRCRHLGRDQGGDKALFHLRLCRHHWRYGGAVDPDLLVWTCRHLHCFPSS